MPSKASELAEQFGVEYQAPHETRMKFHMEGDAYIAAFPSVGVAFEVSAVEVSKSDFHGLVRVTSTVQGTPPLIHAARCNLSGTSARASLVKYLNARLELRDWSELVEQVCFKVLDAVREGNPVVRLSNVADRTELRFRVAPLLIEGFPNIIFGPGGSGKSLLAAVVGMAVHDGWQLAGLEVVPGPVLVCDWELDAVTYKEQVALLSAGFNIAPPDLHYRQCVAPLPEESAAIARYVAREGIQLVIVDSLGFAIGGDKTSQELTLKMFRSIRSWNVTTLCVDHITNDEANGNRPYGSVYTINSARALWRVRSDQEEGSSELSIGLFQTKANFGKQPPLGFRVRFGDGETVVERADVRDIPSAAVKEGLTDRIRIKTTLLEAREALNRDDISTRSGVEKGKVQARLGEMLKRGEVVKLDPPTGTTYAPRWALQSYHQEGG